MAAHWSDDIENILKKIRLNSLLRSKYHKISYFNMNKLLKYFRIPVIVLSGISSVFSVALQPYIPIQTTAFICCFISLTVGLIGSIEMFLQIQKRMEIDLHNSKTFTFLATDITKVLNLARENRTVDGLTYLEEKMNEYNSLVDLSIVIDLNLHEKILELNLIDNLTEEEELSILSNDNLQSIFRRYKLLFLTKQLEQGTNTSTQELPLPFAPPPTPIHSPTPSLCIRTEGITENLESDIDDILRQRSNSKSTIMSTIASAIPTLPLPLPLPIPHVMRSQRRSGSRGSQPPSRKPSSHYSFQNAADIADQLRMHLESLPEAKNETETSTPRPSTHRVPSMENIRVDIEGVDIEENTTRTRPSPTAMAFMMGGRDSRESSRRFFENPMVPPGPEMKKSGSLSSKSTLSKDDIEVDVYNEATKSWSSDAI